MSRTRRWRRIVASRRRRHTIGPASWLDRLKRAALDDHVCQVLTVRIAP